MPFYISVLAAGHNDLKWLHIDYISRNIKRIYSTDSLIRGNHGNRFVSHNVGYITYT